MNPVEDHSIGWNSIKMLEKKFERIFLLKKGQGHTHDLVTRRSITGILVMLNHTPIRWRYKRQKTVETSTYGSELVASRNSLELILEVRYVLWSLEWRWMGQY
jgi:hypothetical protein